MQKASAAGAANRGLHKRVEETEQYIHALERGFFALMFRQYTLDD